ncbi:MAG: prolipoprotein diacylglyceryl transferase [Phycisphaerales bacterium]
MLTALAQGAWLHDLDPVLLPLSGSLAIRWYGLAYVGGFIIAWALVKWLARRKLVEIRPEFVSDFILAAVVGVLVGGRLGYALVYGQHLFTDFSSSFPFWALLDITNGGMASHGGMVGLILASVWVARREKTSTFHVLDTLALVAGPGVVLGRIANFVNGELLGKVVAGPGEPAPWWSVRFPQELLDRPTDAQVAWVNTLNPMPGDPEAYESIVNQMIVSIREGVPEVRRAVEPILHARHPSQLYQACAEGVVVFVVLWWIARRARRPGVLSAWFLIVYGVGRIATEFIRLPDAGLGRWLGLSRGQWLSAVMVLGGVALLVFIAQRAKRDRWPAAVGGWARARTDSGAGGDDAAGDGDPTVEAAE